jgi:NADPH2:quinone reductase
VSCNPKEDAIALEEGAVRGLSAVFAGAGRIRVQPVLVPPPEPGQLRVRLEGCGICASNLPVWEGRPWFDYPLPPGAPGHEGWGRVDAVGAGTEGFAVGDRVALLSDHAYAQYDLVEASSALRLPPELDGLDFPGEPLACAMNIFDRSRIKAGETVAVVGIGFLGALLARLAAEAGARVIALSRRPYALDLARRLGATATVASHDLREAARRIFLLTGDAGCDCVIEAAGEQSTLDLASRLTKVRGRLVIAGYHQDGPRQVNLQLWNWRGLDVINAHERDPGVYLAGMRKAIEAVGAGWLDPAPLLTHRVRLAQLPMAFQLLKERPDGFMKAILLP